jgi:DNA-directed RNA polymerase specialized sigma24 family protein
MLGSEITQLRKRRGLVAHRRYGDGYYIIAEARPVERVGESQRAPASNRDHARVPEDVRQRVRTLRVEGLTLREVAAAVGVSHETVRTILREPEASLTVD